MKLNFCVICGVEKDLQHHHIVPLSLGGEDTEHNLITLCCDHHDWIHNIKRTRSLSFSELVKAGQQKSGNFGGRPKIPKEKEEEICKLWLEGYSYRQIRSKTGVAMATIKRVSESNNLPRKEPPPKSYRKLKGGQYVLF